MATDRQLLAPVAPILPDATEIAHISDGGMGGVTAQENARNIKALTTDQVGVANGFAALGANGRYLKENFEHLNSGETFGTYNIQGPTTMLRGVAAPFFITNFDTNTAITVSVSAGSVSRVGNQLNVTPPTTGDSFDLTVNSRKVTIKLVGPSVLQPKIVTPSFNAKEISLSLRLEASRFSTMPYSSSANNTAVTGSVPIPANAFGVTASGKNDGTNPSYVEVNGIPYSFSDTLSTRQIPFDFGTDISSMNTVVGGTGSFTYAWKTPSETHESSDWQIAYDAAFTQIYKQSANDTVNKVYYMVDLEPGKTYYARMRMKGSVNGLSPWSDTVKFSTQIYGFPSREVQVPYNGKAFPVDNGLPHDSPVALSGNGKVLVLKERDLPTVFATDYLLNVYLQQQDLSYSQVQSIRVPTGDEVCSTFRNAAFDETGSILLVHTTSLYNTTESGNAVTYNRDAVYRYLKGADGLYTLSDSVVPAPTDENGIFIGKPPLNQPLWNPIAISKSGNMLAYTLSTAAGLGGNFNGCKVIARPANSLSSTVALAFYSEFPITGIEFTVDAMRLFISTRTKVSVYKLNNGLYELEAEIPWGSGEKKPFATDQRTGDLIYLTYTGNVTVMKRTGVAWAEIFEIEMPLVGHQANPNTIAFEGNCLIVGVPSSGSMEEENIGDVCLFLKVDNAYDYLGFLEPSTWKPSSGNSYGNMIQLSSMGNVAVIGMFDKTAVDRAYSSKVTVFR